MRRRDLLLTAVAVPWLSAPVMAQAPERVWRVGVLTPSQSGESTIRQFTLPELAKLGFQEGRNLAYQVFSADDAPSACPLLQPNLWQRSRMSSSRWVQARSGRLTGQPAPFP
jgi:putative ABC transport system substrate-binding protein